MLTTDAKDDFYRNRHDFRSPILNDRLQISPLGRFVPAALMLVSVFVSAQEAPSETSTSAGQHFDAAFTAAIVFAVVLAIPRQSDW